MEKIIEIIKQNITVNKEITKWRKDYSEMNALINGDNFADLLINKIEHLESNERAKARKLYSRNINDLIDRLLLPIDNVFTATGAVWRLADEQKTIDTKFSDGISNFHGGKNIESYIQNSWVKPYHFDPNGIIFVTYTTVPTPKCYPTYQSINAIRNYKADGQAMEWLLFEPNELKDNLTEWRYVDATHDYIVVQRGNSFTIDIERTFAHPFGACPAIVISNLTEVGEDERITPFESLKGLLKEYANDLSVKTIFKRKHGMPMFWRMVKTCQDCSNGKVVGTNSERTICKTCNGTSTNTKDITDEIQVRMPDREGITLPTKFAGFEAPDLATWGVMTEELEYLDRKAYETLWGVTVLTTGNQTATGRFIDLQPFINKLNKYADVKEWIEWRLNEFCYNFYVSNSEKTFNNVVVTTGRNFIIESPNALIEKYNIARKDGVNTVVLDNMLREYLQAKYRNDISQLAKELKRLAVQPYNHYTIDQIKANFGDVEANKQNYFDKWWLQLDYNSTLLTADKLILKFEEDYSNKYTNIATEDNGVKLAQNNLRSLSGGVDSVLAITIASEAGTISKNSAKTLLINFFGVTEEEVNKIII